MKKRKWKKHSFEFLSIFIAVISAFALNNWTDNRRDDNAEIKILEEISNGLENDIDDIRINMEGHEAGIRACNYWRRAINNEEIDQDSLSEQYHNLVRDYISIQNSSGYESLKSKGLEIVKNDSLRYDIISLHEYDFNVLKKFEEEYNEMQFHRNYFNKIDNLVSQNFVFDSLGRIRHIDLPLKLNKIEKNKLMTYLWKIETNRRFILRYYAGVEEKIVTINDRIKEEIE